MNIWTGLLFLHSHLPDAELARSLVGPEAEASATPPGAAQQREQETLDTRRAVPLWRSASWIAIR